MDLLTRFFPQHMDRLEREKAHFPGDGPLLLSSLTTDDLAILLSGSERKASQASRRCPLYQKLRSGFSSITTRCCCPAPSARPPRWTSRTSEPDSTVASPA